MSNTNIFLLDSTGRLLGKIDSTRVVNGWHEGKIEFIDFPIELRELFAEYEKLVNEQVFAQLEDLERKIENWGLKLSDDNIPRDIQIMNSNDIVFRLGCNSK